MGLSGIGAVYALAAAALVSRYRSPSAAIEAGDWPAVSLLKPLHGDEPELAANLESLLAQNYRAPVQVVLGLRDEADTALPLARALSLAHPVQVTLVLDPDQHGANRKVSNLINLTAAARHDLLVQSDSDIAVDAGYLGRIAARLAAPGVGLVTSLYIGQGRAGGWSRLAAMNLSYAFLPSVVVGVALGLAKPCMGSTIALSRQTLERIGGWRAVADVLADDYEVGRAVRALGLGTVLAPGAVTHACSERTLAEVWRHELRWALTVREIDPAGFFGSFVTHAIPLALVGLLLCGGAPAGWIVLALAIAARLWLKFRVDRTFGSSAGAWWLLPARDMLSAIVFIAALVGRSIEWRGSRYTVAKGGVLRSSGPVAGQD